MNMELDIYDGKIYVKLNDDGKKPEQFLNDKNYKDAVIAKSAFNEYNPVS